MDWTLDKVFPYDFCHLFSSCHRWWVNLATLKTNRIHWDLQYEYLHENYAKSTFHVVGTLPSHDHGSLENGRIFQRQLYSIGDTPIVFSRAMIVGRRVHPRSFSPWVLPPLTHFGFKPPRGQPFIWSNYSDLNRPISPKWWFRKGILAEGTSDEGKQGNLPSLKLT